LAIAQLAMWLAIGSFAIPNSLDRLVAVPSALLVGSGVTAAIYAILTYTGHVDAALVGCTSVGAGSLIMRAGWVRDAVTRTWLEFAPIVGDIRSRVVVLGLCVLYWLDSIVPPRDGDVMRYHLAHVRQIIRDGRWVPLPDYTYALPFGWTMNFLPFERLHLVEASHLANLGLWLLTLVVLGVLLRRKGAPFAAFILLLVVALQPLMLKSATTAHADLYSVFVVLAIVLFLLELPTLDTGQMMLLGFVSTIGAQSRYQLLGVSVVVLIIGLAHLAGKRISIKSFGAAMAGAALGLAVASPFYIVNYLAFKNPFWPLLVAKLNGLQLYADRVADNVNRSLSGPYSIVEYVHAFRTLMFDPVTFPIPILALLSVAAPLWSRDRVVRVSALFGGLFLLTWAVTQPSLYPRFSILLVPALVIGLGLSCRFFASRRIVNALICSGLLLAAGGFFAFDLFYSRDGVRYVVTGDEATYHQATWFYPVYKWVNETAPRGARFLVVVASGHSYYLDRNYRRADPFLSGYIDWDAVTSAQQLRDILSCSQFEYVIYNPAAAVGQLGGRNLDAAIHFSIDEGLLTIARRFDITLVTRRVNGEGEPATVLVLHRAFDGSVGACDQLKTIQPFLD
jgi:hypothetical protein